MNVLGCLEGRRGAGEVGVEGEVAEVGGEGGVGGEGEECAVEVEGGFGRWSGGL